MNYDKNSFLSGIAVGRQLKGWSTTYKRAQQSGSGDVNFYDYDGTIIDSYSSAEFAALNELPANPLHDGLLAQGWNWTIEQAKAHVSKYGKLDIGQTYITADGKTRIYIHLDDGRLDPYLCFAINGTAVVDWGDGSYSTVTGTSLTERISTQHVYGSEGDYVVAIAVTGSLVFYGSSTYGSYLLWKNEAAENVNRMYQNCIKKIEIGTGIAKLSAYSLYRCFSLKIITIPNSVTTIERNAFFYCRSLESVTIPQSVTGIGAHAFAYCYSLKTISIPYGRIEIPERMFGSCYMLSRVTLPDSLQFIRLQAFLNCYGLTSIIIPQKVVFIGEQAFSACINLETVSFPYRIDSPYRITQFKDSVFSSCMHLTSFVIPDQVTTIEQYAFMDCANISSLIIPNSVTSIAANAFSRCYGLLSVTIPNSVTSIGGNAFANCSGLGYIKFEATTPPTVSSSTAFSGVPADCVIYVPSGSLSAYTSAANYPSSSTYLYIEY